VTESKIGWNSDERDLFFHDSLSISRSMLLLSGWISDDIVKHNILVPNSVHENLNHLTVQSQKFDNLIYRTAVWLSASEAPQISEPCMVSQILDEENFAQFNGVTTAPELNFELKISKESLSLVFKEIMDNIDQHADGKGPEISFKSDCSHLTIHIFDSGDGLSDAQMIKALKPFEGASSTPTKGSGLGLAIAHRVVSAANGELTLGNACGGGLMVSISLPRKI
jgi:light-regulated signal transduction histidine kinase (bacteriophytochrome)